MCYLENQIKEVAMSRKNGTQRLTLVAVMLCVVMALGSVVGCAKQTPPTTVAPVAAVKIGVSLPLSGQLASYGKRDRYGIDFVVGEINKAGGIKRLGGAPIEIVWSDNAADPKVALTEFERLMTAEKVSMVLGPQITGLSVAVANLGDKYKVPILDVLSSGIGVYEQNLTYYRTTGTPRDPDGIGLATFLNNLINEYNAKCTRIAIMLEDTPTGKAMLTTADATLKQLGLGDKIVIELLYDQAATDQSPNILKIKAASPDVLLGGGASGSLAAVCKAMYAVDFIPPIWVNNEAAASKTIFDALGPDLTAKVLKRPNVFAMNPFPDGVPLQGIPDKPFQDFATKWNAWAKSQGIMQSIDYFVDGGAQAMYIAKRVMEDTGSTNPTVLNDALRKLSLKKGDPDNIMLTPLLEWDSTGKQKAAVRFCVQWQQQTGQVEIVYPTEFRTHGAWVN